jgi:hypothetical protein
MSNFQSVFPFKKIRNQQEQALEFVSKSDKKFIVLEMPT